MENHPLREVGRERSRREKAEKRERDPGGEGERGRGRGKEEKERENHTQTGHRETPWSERKHSISLRKKLQALWGGPRGCPRY